MVQDGLENLSRSLLRSSKRLMPMRRIPHLGQQILLLAGLTPQIDHSTSRRVQNCYSERWPPSMKLVDPLFHDGCRTDHNDRSSELLAIVQTSKECYDLYCLAKTH